MRTQGKGSVLAVWALLLQGCGGNGNSPDTILQPPPAPPTALATGPNACSGGAAGSFSCSGISLLQRIPLEQMDGTLGNDVWGWFDVQSGKEYALMGMTNGTAFVDITDPENPLFIGRLATQSTESTWRDMKVYENHAYIVADNAGAHGMQVFDLTRLRNLTTPQTFAADLVYGDFDNAHNVAIDEATGFAYAVGTNTCAGGLRNRVRSNPAAVCALESASMLPLTHAALQVEPITRMVI